MVNNNNKLFQIVMYLVGLILTLTLIVGFPMLIKNVIANEKESQTRDQQIRRDMLTVERKFNDKVDKIVEGQTIKFEEQGQKLFDIKELILAVKYHIENGK